MKREIRIVFVALTILTFGRLASFSQGEISVDALRSPASPALVLTGVSPSAIERPETPKALFASVAAVLSSQQQTALGFAPYWLTGHPDLSFERFAHPDPLQALMQNADVSLLYAPASAGQTTYAAGLRTALGPFGPAPGADPIKIMTVWQLILVNLESDVAAPGFSTSSFLALLDQRTKEAIAANPDVEPYSIRIELRERDLSARAQPAIDANNASALDDLVKSESSSTEETNKQLVLTWQDLRSKQQGLSLEFSGAFSTVSASGEIKDSKLDKVDAWVTILYPFQAFDGLACVQWIRSEVETSALDDVDGGARFLYSTEHLQVGGEGLARWELQNSDLRYRLAITVKLTEASLGVLDLSAGKDYGASGSSLSGDWFFSVGITMGSGPRIALK